MDKSNIHLISCDRSIYGLFAMYKVKRLVTRLGGFDLPTCFFIECQGESELMFSWLFYNQTELTSSHGKPHNKKTIKRLALVTQSRS